MAYFPPFLLLLSLSWASSAASTESSFRECMLTQVGSDSIILSSSSSVYTQVLEFSQQNPRWLNSSRKPVLIITPVHESEIQVAILCSRKHELQVRVRSGGHDYEGLSFLSDTPFIIIDLIYLRSIEINLAEETAWVQAGATLGELYYKIANLSKVHGFPAGLCPSVGLGGHVSGGGFGTMLRKFGLAADNVLDAYLIDVNGKLLDRQAMGKDLFWAIRGGGGGSFGIVLAWKIRLVRVPATVTAFTVERTDQEGATKLIHRWQYIANKLHEDLFIRIIAQKLGRSGQGIKASFNSLFLGGKDKLIPLMKQSFPELGLQAKDCIEMSWIQSILYFAGYHKDDHPELLLNRITSYKSFYKAKSDFVNEPVSETALEGVWKMFQEEDVLTLLIADPYGGRMDEISESATPFPHRKGNIYNIQYMIKWDVNNYEAENRHVQWIRKLYRYMTPYVSKSPRSAYVNYRDLDIGTNKHSNTSYSEASVWGKKYFKGNFRRLAHIKTKVDPQNFFRNEQSLPILSPVPASKLRA
ncbi:hypothetical protein L6164_037032 [Bauhinia variegata]|uniref:Uncharacterized protein n=1 Tax=Bauhinia variegata TaxID=167791 RepID=A0ACB9KIU9_BAUVA|nr:hypothetical protein L6164_037032 [Bauhinia variegata]